MSYTPQVTSYNAKDCSVIVSDVYITALGEDMINIEKEEALAENVVGAQGDIVRSEINNSIYNISVTIQPTSPQLKHLISLKNSADFFPVWVVNKSLGIRAGGSKAKILEMPAIALGATAEDIEVTFCVYDGELTVE